MGFSISRIFIAITTIQLYILWLYINITKKHLVLSKTIILEYKGTLIYFLTLSSILCCIFSYVIYKNVIKRDETNEFELTEKLKLIKNLLSKINIFYKIYDIIFIKLGTGSPYVLFIIAVARKILDYSDKKNLVIIFSFVTLPRIIIVITFLGEIFFTQQLHYYFYALYLLLIPLLFKTILFMLRDVQERVYPEARSMVIHEMHPIVIHNKIYGNLILKLKPEFYDVDPNIYFPKFFNPLMYIEGHLDVIITPIYIKFHLITLFLYHLCHILGLAYILLYII